MLVSKEQYKDLSAEELVADEFFANSVQKPTPDSEQFWKEFLLEYPQQEAAVNTATSFVKQMRFVVDNPSNTAKQRVWEKVIASAKESPVIPIKKKLRWVWIAASLTGVLLVASIWYLSGDAGNINIQSRFGEIKELVLPDNSKVVLNANSSIEYKKNWNKGEVREVWLKGEGFFEVKHLNREGEEVRPYERFIVHAGNAQVEVLGTSFNVSDRETVTKVVLQSGKVRVDFKDEKGSVLMEPGELVKYDRKTKQVQKEKTNTENQLSWKRKELLLDSTSFREVMKVIENNLGYKVVMDDDKLLDKQISAVGKVSLEDEEILFRSLELMLNITITRKDKQLYIKSN